MPQFKHFIFETLCRLGFGSISSAFHCADAQKGKSTQMTDANGLAILNMLFVVEKTILVGNAIRGLNTVTIIVHLFQGLTPRL